MKCPRCQQENPPQAKFCVECGAPVDGGAPLARSHADLQSEIEALRTSLSDSRERQAATEDILRIISRAQTDVQPVFDTIADSAIRLLQGWSALILLYDGELLHLGAVRGGLPDSERYQKARFPMRLQPDHLLAQCIVDRFPRQHPDACAHPSPLFREMARRRGYGAFVAVPMLRGDDAIGEIVVTRAKAGPFEESAVALLQTFADQAVIAIENVRLFTELQEKNRALTQAHAQVSEALEQQMATGEILRAISSSPTDAQRCSRRSYEARLRCAAPGSPTFFDWRERSSTSPHTTTFRSGRSRNSNAPFRSPCPRAGHSRPRRCAEGPSFMFTTSTSSRPSPLLCAL
jgi:GAF domain-containing protein